MQNRLVVYKDGRIDLSFPVADSGARIGREGDNHVQLMSAEVSKHHAVVLRAAAGWTIRDTNSRNGILLNGEKVAESPLKDGDRIRIGPYELVFETGVAPDRSTSHMVLDLSRESTDKTLIQPQ